MKTLNLTKIDEILFKVDFIESEVEYTLGSPKIMKKVSFSKLVSKKDLVSKMDKFGIDASETMAVLSVFEEEGHNKASFGFLGTLSSSWNTFNNGISGKC